MAALCNRAGHYIFALWFLSFLFFSLPNLSSRRLDFTILLHMVWLRCEFRMQVWNVLHTACWKIQDPKSRHLGTIAHLCRAISSQLRHVLTIGKKLVKQQYFLHMSPQCGELRPTSGWDRFVSLGHPCKFRRVSRLDNVTAWHSSIGRQLNFAALNRGRHLYVTERLSRSALGSHF